RLEGEVRNHSKTLVTALETFDRYPGRHSRHFDKHARADWSGLLNAPFDWKDPGPGIAAGLGDFLPVRAAAGGP
ncbi:MAG TPA: hypothetical protein VNY05_04940, partial [Candidatus Acidoferrales bacterium]|nr:hypothetical protein [Candidatus Acidoferrales bacterium]